MSTKSEACMSVKVCNLASLTACHQSFSGGTSYAEASATMLKNDSNAGYIPLLLKRN